MKKTLIYIPNKTILITLFFTIAGATAALCNPTPPPPSSFSVSEQLPVVEMDFYMIPMMIILILFSLFYILKRTLAFNDKI